MLKNTGKNPITQSLTLRVKDEFWKWPLLVKLNRTEESHVKVEEKRSLS